MSVVSVGALGWNELPLHEEGSNSHAYIVCPSCSQENIQYGFGEEDY
ncbi:hypothetical protein [Streptomyces himastatinicus]|nr:hypothetical protein [Streptomyces himastatinicus]